MVQLETQNRRLKHGLVFLAMGFSTIFMMGQAQPDKIPQKLEAENFILRGPRGEERGRFGVAANGHPYLVLLNKSGTPSVSLGKLHGHATRRIKGKVITFGDGPNEGYYDKDGQPRSTIPYQQWLKEKVTEAQKTRKPAESLVVLFDDSGDVFWSIP